MLRASTTSLLALAATVACLSASPAGACDKDSRAQAAASVVCAAKDAGASKSACIAKSACVAKGARSASTMRIAAAAKPKPATPAKPAATKAAPGTAGMRVAIEPETGALVPDAGVQTAGGASLRSGADLEQLRQNVVVERRADGSMHANVMGIVEDYAVASIGPDGKLQFTCVQGRDEAEKVVQKAAPSRKTKKGAK